MPTKSKTRPMEAKPIFHNLVIFLSPLGKMQKAISLGLVIVSLGYQGFANSQVVVSSSTSTPPSTVANQSYVIDSGVTVSAGIGGQPTPISSFTNNGLITSPGGSASLYFQGVGTGISGNMTNNGQITSAGAFYSFSIMTGTLGGLINNSAMNSPGFSTTLFDSSNVGSIQNTGTITSGAASGSAIRIQGNTAGNYSISSISNSNALTSSLGYGLRETSSTANLTIGTITNSGTITAGIAGMQFNNTALISTINNTGTINAPTGIANLAGAAITTLNNSQGAGNTAGALTYNGALPTNYNIIINGNSSYGQLSINGASTGTMNLNISNSSTLAAGTYSSVLSGFNANGMSSSSVVNPLASNITDSANKVWYYSFNNGLGIYNLVVAGAAQSVTTNGLTVTGLALSGLGSTVASKLDGGVFVVDGLQSKSNSITLTSNGGTIDQAGNSATLSGVISDQTTGGKLVVTNSGTAGSGVLVLSSNNTYTGGTTVNAGANLSISSANNLGTGTLNLVGTSTTSATLTTTANMTINNAIKVTADPTFNIASGTTTAVSSSIADGASAGDVVVAGGGTLALTAANTYTGSTTINSGSTLALTGSGSVASSSGVVNNGTVDISSTTSGASVVALSGSGAVALGAKTLTVTNGSRIFSGAIGGTGGGLVVSGGVQTLSGANTYTGGTTINSGSTLALTGSGSIVAAGGVLDNGTLNLSSTTPYAGIISGTGNLVVSGGAQSTLSGINTYTGGTTINSGSTLALTGGGSVASSSGVIGNGTFNIQGTTSPVTIKGYTQASTGTLATSISTTNSTTPQLIVNGTATLNGGLVSVYANPGSYIGGTKYTLLNATGGVVGTFSNSIVKLTGGTLMSGRLSYDALDVYMTLGPSPSDTQQSLTNSAAVLRNTFTLQNSVLANSFSYDCTEFGANGICISAGGRNTAVSAANGLNNTSALLIAAYRPHPNYRIGAYADQNLSMNNAGSTVNLGNNAPLIGLFGVWNEKVDGTGAEIKATAAYGQKNATVTRQVVGSSEPGSGGANLTSQGAQMTVKYGFAILKNIIVSPYAGVRYTQNNMGGYTEGTSAAVTAPLTYGRLNTNATTALAGLGASYQLTPVAMMFASAGVESDTNTANGSYSATSPYIPGLTPINFNASPVKTRPTAMLGAYYDVVKNQRLGITGIYRQEAYQGVSTTSVMATYAVGI